MRREYLLRLMINGRLLNRVVVDSHYEIKHFRVINDTLILELVKSLNGRTFEADSLTTEGWEVYVNDSIYLGQKRFRLVWCLHPDEDCIGIINVFRRSHGKVSQ